MSTFKIPATIAEACSIEQNESCIKNVKERERVQALERELRHLKGPYSEYAMAEVELASLNGKD